MCSVLNYNVHSLYVSLYMDVSLVHDTSVYTHRTRKNFK